MARDIFVRFNHDRKPTRQEVQYLLEDYFKGIATNVRWDSDRFFVSLPGTQTNALGRMPDAHHLYREPDGKRWIEVWLADPDPAYKNQAVVDVMTRQADEVTNAMAEGVVEILARFWKGEVESG